MRKSNLTIGCVRNNITLEVSTYFDVTKTNKTFELLIHQPKSEKTGEFRFILTNDKGSDIATVHINIIDKNLEIFLNVISIFTAPSILDKYQQINVVF